MSNSNKTKIIKINNKRVFLSKIREYGIYTTKIHHQNDKLRPKGLINSFLHDHNENWDTTILKYLYIEMYNADKYRFYSDTDVHNIYDKLHEDYKDVNYLNGKDPDFGPHNTEAYSSYKTMNNLNLTYITESIDEVIQKLDNAFDIL